jgi:hypothetical protein
MVNGSVTLSVGQVGGPAPLATISLSPTSVTAPGQATLTLSDHHAPGSLRPGAVYRVTVTATSGSNVQALTLFLLVGGTNVYLPTVR